MCQQGAVQMKRDAELALAISGEMIQLRSHALLFLGVSEMLLGASGARDTLERAYEAATAAGTTTVAALALTERAVLAAAETSWTAAETLLVDAREDLARASVDHYPTSALTFAVDARSAIRRSDWVRARHDLERTRALLPTLGPSLPWLAVQVRLEAARAYLELSEREAASVLLNEARTITAQVPGLTLLEAGTEELGHELEKWAKAGSSWGALTPAEWRLLPLLMTHLSFREIGEFLHVSRNTVKTQAISTYRKLGVSSRSEAISRAVELGYIPQPEGLEPPTDGPVIRRTR
jgi:LuxR family maltose regulon positive regulatory protein